MISKTPEDYQYYEDRLKYLRDEEAKLADAKQEGRQEGLEQGREEGEVKLIRTLQEILGEPMTAESDLGQYSFEQLQSITAELRSRILRRS